MPIYEYVCQSCGQATEALRKLSDPPLLDCPHCGAPQLKKKVSAAAFRLKGGGWYETDFKQGSKKNLAGEGGGADSAGGDKPADKPAGNAGADGAAGTKSDTPAKSGSTTASPAAGKTAGSGDSGGST